LIAEEIHGYTKFETKKYSKKNVVISQKICDGKVEKSN
jgi:hypothetical protein